MAALLSNQSNSSCKSPMFTSTISDLQDHLPLSTHGNTIYQHAGQPSSFRVSCKTWFPSVPSRIWLQVITLQLPLFLHFGAVNLELHLCLLFNVRHCHKSFWCYNHNMIQSIKNPQIIHYISVSVWCTGGPAWSSQPNSTGVESKLNTFLFFFLFSMS